MKLFDVEVPYLVGELTMGVGRFCNLNLLPLTVGFGLKWSLTHSEMLAVC